MKTLRNVTFLVLLGGLWMSSPLGATALLADFECTAGCDCHPDILSPSIIIIDCPEEAGVDVCSYLWNGCINYCYQRELEINAGIYPLSAYCNDNFRADGCWPDARSSEKFMHGIRVLMAKNYIDNLSEEVRKGMREKAEQGQGTGRGLRMWDT